MEPMGKPRNDRDSCVLSELRRAFEDCIPAFADEALQLPPTEMERELRHAIRPLCMLCWHWFMCLFEGV